MALRLLHGTTVGLCVEKSMTTHNNTVVATDSGMPPVTTKTTFHHKTQALPSLSAATQTNNNGINMKSCKYKNIVSLLAQ